MADITALENRIRSLIKTNGNQEITGAVAQQILLDIADSLNVYLEAEAAARQNGDSTLSGSLNTEMQARQQADNNETQARQQADNALHLEIQQEAQRAKEDFYNQELIDSTGSALQPTQITLTLQKNDGSEQDPEWNTISQLVIPSATALKAGLMSADIYNFVNNVIGLHFLPVNQYSYTHRNGVIGSSTKQWTYTGSANRQHIVIPIPSGVENIYVQANDENTTYLAFLSSYNVSEGQDASVIGEMLTAAVGRLLSAEVPEGANYLYIQVKSGSLDYTPKYVSFADDFFVESALRQQADNALHLEIQQEAQRAEAAFDNLELLDTTGSALQSTQITITLRKNDGTEEDPDWRTLTDVILPLATAQRAGLMSAIDYVASREHFLPVNQYSYTHRNGFINTSTKQWTDTGSTNRQHIAIPIPSGVENIYIQANDEYDTYLAFLSSYNVSEGQDASVIGNILDSPVGILLSIEVPEGANYLYIQVKSGSFDYTPKYVSFADDIKRLEDNLHIETQRIDDINNLTTSHFIPTDLSQYTHTRGYINISTKKWVDTGSTTRQHIAIPVVSGQNYILISSENYASYIFLSEYNVVEGGDCGYVSSFSGVKNIGTVPEGANYLYIQVKSGPLDYTPKYVSFADDVVDLIIYSREIDESIKENALKNDASLYQDGIDEVINFSLYTPAKGYITSEGLWAGVTSTGRQHVAIPVDASNIGKRLVIKRGIQLYVKFLSAYNPVNNADAGVINAQTVFNEYGLDVFIIPEGCTFIYFQVKSGDLDYTPISTYIQKVASELSGSGILELNPKNEVLPKLMNITRPYMQYGVSASIPCLRILHFSDLHGSNENIERIKQFQTEYSDYIDDVIQTGDIHNYPTIPNSYRNYCTDFLNVIGNHEAKDPTTRELQPELSLYNIYLKDYINNWNVIQPTDADIEGKCYYYKDYTDSKVRLIAINCMHWNATQKSWLESTLADAITNELHVVCAIHIPPFLTTKPNTANPFDSIDEPMNAGGLSDSQIAGCVKSFIDNGGEFACWICGHIHDDVMGIGVQGSGFENQLVISIATASVAPATPYSTMARSNGNRTNDCFNVLAIDTVSKTVKIVRIGANYDRYMRRKNTLSWNYELSQLIYCD